KIITENPFPASHRKYPVELPYLRDIQYILTYQLPEGFVPEEQVEQEKTWLLNKQKDLSFVNKIDFLEEQGKLQVYSRYSENNHYLPAQDYDFLRSFYERLVEVQNQKIVLKKL